MLRTADFDLVVADPDADAADVVLGTGVLDEDGAGVLFGRGRPADLDAGDVAVQAVDIHVGDLADAALDRGDGLGTCRRRGCSRCCP